MNKQQTEQKIQQLLKAMATAIEQKHWQQVRSVDQQLLALFTQAKRMPWYVTWQPVRDDLKRQYQHFLLLLGEQRGDLQRSMKRHQNDGHGIIAYKQLIEETGQ